jgi:hypothetical protein
MIPRSRLSPLFSQRPQNPRFSRPAFAEKTKRTGVFAPIQADHVRFAANTVITKIEKNKPLTEILEQDSEALNVLRDTIKEAFAESSDPKIRLRALCEALNWSMTQLQNEVSRLNSGSENKLEAFLKSPTTGFNFTLLRHSKSLLDALRVWGTFVSKLELPQNIPVSEILSDAVLKQEIRERLNRQLAELAETSKITPLTYREIFEGLRAKNKEGLNWTREFLASQTRENTEDASENASVISYLKERAYITLKLKTDLQNLLTTLGVIWPDKLQIDLEELAILDTEAQENKWRDQFQAALSGGPEFPDSQVFPLSTIFRLMRGKQTQEAFSQEKGLTAGTYRKVEATPYRLSEDFLNNVLACHTTQDLNGATREKCDLFLAALKKRWHAEKSAALAAQKTRGQIPEELATWAQHFLSSLPELEPNSVSPEALFQTLRAASGKSQGQFGDLNQVTVSTLEKSFLKVSPNTVYTALEIYTGFFQDKGSKITLEDLSTWFLKASALPPHTKEKYKQAFELEAQVRQIKQRLLQGKLTTFPTEFFHEGSFEEGSFENRLNFLLRLVQIANPDSAKLTMQSIGNIKASQYEKFLPTVKMLVSITRLFSEQLEAAYGVTLSPEILLSGNLTNPEKQTLFKELDIYQRAEASEIIRQEIPQGWSIENRLRLARYLYTGVQNSLSLEKAATDSGVKSLKNYELKGNNTISKDTLAKLMTFYLTTHAKIKDPKAVKPDPKAVKPDPEAVKIECEWLFSGIEVFNPQSSLKFTLADLISEILKLSKAQASESPDKPSETLGSFPSTGPGYRVSEGI